jgi:outer membrane protein
VAKVDEASSPYYPQLTATASYARQTGNAVPRPGTFTVNAPWSLSRTFNTFNAGVTGTMMLYDFGQVRGRVHAAEASVDASKASEKNVGALMLLSVRKAFFQARAQKALTKVATEVLENQKRHLAQVEAFVAVGTRPDIDLAQERTNIANARLSLLNARTNYELARAQLNQAMGIVATTGYDVADDEIGHVEGEELGTDQLISQAIAQRPDIIALERQRDAAQATLASLKASYAPTLAAQGSVTEGGIALDAMVPNWSLGVTLTWPLYQGGITRAQVRETEATVQVVQAQIDAIRLQVSVDIEQSRLSVRSAKEGIDAAGEVLASAREQLRLAEGRYKAGIGSVIELGDAQLAVINASAQVIQAQYNLSTARAQLMLALGKP